MKTRDCLKLQFLSKIELAFLALWTKKATRLNMTSLITIIIIIPINMQKIKPAVACLLLLLLPQEKINLLHLWLIMRNPHLHQNMKFQSGNRSVSPDVYNDLKVSTKGPWNGTLINRNPIPAMTSLIAMTETVPRLLPPAALTTGIIIIIIIIITISIVIPITITIAIIKTTTVLMIPGPNPIPNSTHHPWPTVPPDMTAQQGTTTRTLWQNRGTRIIHHSRAASLQQPLRSNLNGHPKRRPVVIIPPLLLQSPNQNSQSNLPLP